MIPGWPTDTSGKAKKMFAVSFKSEIFLPANYGFNASYPNPENQYIDLSATRK